MAQAKAQSRNRTRRARSADQASAYMEEKLTEALRAGKAPKLDSRKMEVRLPLGPRKNVVLVKADGTVTDEGKHVYREMGVPAPSIYPYEQGLINGKWVNNFAGAASTKTLVVGRGGKPTAKGENYFKYNRDEYETSFPVRIARVPRKHEWRLDPTPLQNRTEYQTRHIDQDHFGEPILALTVGKLGKSHRNTPYHNFGLHMVPEERREAHTREAAQRWAETSQKIMAYDPISRETKEWYVILLDSPHWYVYDPERPITINRIRENIYDRSNPSTDDILQRPLRQFFVVPDGCFRPWDLHPRSFVDDNQCAVSMLHSSFIIQKMEGPRNKRRRVYVEGMEEENIKTELDKIFIDLGYQEGEYPFENTWHTDGVTSSMVIEFCKRFDINCKCIDAKQRLIGFHTARKDRQPNVNFFVRDDHCFWYGSDNKGTAANKAPSAANAFSQKYKPQAQCHDTDTDSDEGGIVETSIDTSSFKQKEIRAFFASDTTPPMTKWKCYHSDLLQIAKENPKAPFKSFRENALPKRSQKDKEKQNIYFYTYSCAWADADLRKLLKEVTDVFEYFSIKPCYGPNPDKITAIVVKAKQCPTIFIKEVPHNWKIYQDMYSECAKSLGLDPEVKMLYKGEGKAKVCERMRVEIMKHYSRKPLTESERNEIKNKCGGFCANCQAELEDEKWEADHIIPLWQDGEDTIKNQEPLCLPCHDEKSENERLYQGAKKTIESTFSRNVLERFVAAPKPQQLVFGNGKEFSIEIDQVGARSNALTTAAALPIFDILDEIKDFDQIHAEVDPNGVTKNANELWEELYFEADFWYIDAGEPLDNPLAALPYMGPNWYWRQNANAIFLYGFSKSGRINLESFKFGLKAKRYTTGNRLDTYYEKIKTIVTTTMAKHEYFNPLEPIPRRPFTEKEIVNEYKGLILAMQGSWTSQQSYSWSVCNIKYDEDAPAAVHMWRPNADGTKRLMMRKELLGNKTMFPIGRIALDLEHLRMFDMLQVIMQLPVRPAIYGCINDCFMLDHITEEDAQKCCQQLTYSDGAPVFKVKDTAGMAPLCKWRYKYNYPKFSPWRAPEEDFPSDLMSKEAYWLLNGSSRINLTLEEPEGLGIFPDGSYDEAFQIEVADKVVENEGALIIGCGGVGKSKVIELMTKKFEEKGFKDQPSTKYPNGRSRVIREALTHVATANLGEDAITVVRSLHQDAKRKKSVFIIDEASMLSLSMWSLIAQLKFTGNVIVILGDFEGQFGPICEGIQEGLPDSTFMKDLVNGLMVTMKKYRRGDDYKHFKFTTSIYPTKTNLENALMAARNKYPLKGVLCMGTSLVVSNRRRVKINQDENDWHAHFKEHVLVKVGNLVNMRDANQPQDMKIWEGIVLMARVSGTCSIKQPSCEAFTLQNGRRYKVISITTADSHEIEPKFKMACINDKDEEVSATFMMSEQDLAKTMRLTHAFTYYSSQARTIRGVIRLCDTDHRNFTLRHLIVGLGRAPRGDVVQVE